MKRFLIGFNRAKHMSIPSFLPKPISEFTEADLGMEIVIPYNDQSGKMYLDNGNIIFQVVGINHHTTDKYKNTLTLMSKYILRNVVFDAAQPVHTQKFISLNRETQYNYRCRW